MEDKRPSVYLDGDWVPHSEARVSVWDRGLQFGHGVFTTVAVRRGYVEAWDLHWKRLVDQSASLGISPPNLGGDRVCEWLRANGADSGIWRMKWMLTGGDQLGVDLGARHQGRLIGLLQPFSESHGPLTVLAFPDPLEGPSSRFKALAYLERLQVRGWARQQGVDEALVSSVDGYLCELACSNLFWILDEVLYYPDPVLPFMDGIASQVARDCWRERGGRLQPVKWDQEGVEPEAVWVASNSLMGLREIQAPQGRPRRIPLWLKEAWERKVQDLGLFLGTN